MSFCEMSFSFINGDVDGAMMCTLSNWSGLAYLIPRIEVRDLEDDQNLRSPGIYMLLGRNENNKEAVFIGMAEDVFICLKSKMKELNFWDEVMVFINDETFCKEQIQYIENELYEQAKNANLYVLLNDHALKISIICSERAELDEFIKGIKRIIDTVGFEIYKKIPPKSEKDIWMIQTVGHKMAEGRQTENGFVVLKESTFCSDVDTSSPPYLGHIRDSLIQTGKLHFIKHKKIFVVTEDITFTNELQAATIALGRMAKIDHWII